MDQVKVFLRQCVRHRFWIALGISLILPMIGYFAGAGAIVAATATKDGEIKGAKAEIEKYQSANPPNPKYKELVDVKKTALTTDVDETWRKLYAIQEPLLKWPDVVEQKFRKWGRKWPENVDPGQVKEAIVDYTIAYRDFLARVYQTCKPWNPDDGTGVVYAPDMDSLLTPAPFLSDTPPPLGKVWAEQERLWVATALLDVVAKANDAVKAKDWDGAIIKQIVSLEVGTNTAEDQKSLAKGVALEPSPVLSPDGAAAPAAPAATGSEMMGPAMGPGMGMGPSGKNDEVFYLTPVGTPPYKVLPVRMTVLVDQAHLPDFLVGLENSPMAIQVMEPEIGRPTTPVIKPIYGETSYAAGGMGSGMMGSGMMGSAMMGPAMGMNTGQGSGRAAMGMTGMGSGYNQNMMGPGGMTSGSAGRMGRSEDMMGSGMMGPGGSGAAAAAKKGLDLRGGENKAAKRKEEAKKDATKKKAVVKKLADPYYNIVEVTVYGQARFYNTPPVPAAVEPSTAPPAQPETPADAPKPDEPTRADAAPARKDDAPKVDPTAPAPAPADAPKAEAGTPAPAPAPKADAPAPKS